jgi:hypothetical protein
VAEWLQCYRIAHKGSLLRARVSKGGEPCGDPDFGRVTKPGEWLCENPENGHRWACSQAAFEELYCEVGKSPPKKEKKQEDGHRKGQSRKRSASHSASNDSVWGAGTLFHEIEEEET